MKTISASEIKQGDLIQYIDDRGGLSQVEAWNVERCTDCVHVFDFFRRVTFPTSYAVEVFPR